MRTQGPLKRSAQEDGAEACVRLPASFCRRGGSLCGVGPLVLGAAGMLVMSVTWMLAWISGTAPSLIWTWVGMEATRMRSVALPRAGDEDALGVFSLGGADGDGHFGGGVTRVGHVDGDQIGAAGRSGGKDAVDGEVGQSLVGVDPVGEEPGGVVVGGVLLQEFGQRAGLSRGCGIAGAERGGEGVVAGDVAEHPEDVGGLGAVVDGGDGLRERDAGAVAGAGGLDEGEGGAVGLKQAESLIAALLFFDP